ncbi:MAG TPA: Rieske 2Fe-2S domain-containing protein [Candidatus Hydrogenedentes bacterium]|nr:Rieske 2Fe-2S domain-containing protein [Candidatus Hydrogenedentota bacterium]HQH68443.1 Rieske 2Fe-2S domain-containing protein [Candidatus Hydrogenedentota bacterium]
MAEWVRVCALEAFPPGSQREVECGMGEPVALFNVAGKIYAISGLCPHEGGPLAEGYVEDGSVYCPWHAWRFSLEPSTEPPNELIRYYRTEIRDGALYVAAPA